MFGMQPLFEHFERGRTFRVEYRCFPVMMMPGNERADVEKGGKIMMPPSALNQLTRLNIMYPMLFKLTSEQTSRATHCGVLEFIADEGKIYIPSWMMRNLGISEGALIRVESVSLPVAKFVKFQPQSVDFLEISNPKAVLESALRSFACLTKDDIIGIQYNSNLYELCVLETKPDNAVSIIECDMNVDFAPPVGYKEPERRPAMQAQEEEEEMAIDPEQLVDKSKFRAFQGSGKRLDGKQKGTEEITSPAKALYERGVPNYDFKPGKLTFIRRSAKQSENDSEDGTPNFEVFGGKGEVLAKKRLKGRKP